MYNLKRSSISAWLDQLEELFKNVCCLKESPFGTNTTEIDWLSLHFDCLTGYPQVCLFAMLDYLLKAWPFPTLMKVSDGPD